MYIQPTHFWQTNKKNVGKMKTSVCLHIVANILTSCMALTIKNWILYSILHIQVHCILLYN